MTITTKTQLCGVIGYPIEHSLSPAIYNAAAAYCKVNAVYMAFEVKNAQDAITAQRALNIVCFSVTIPYKEKVIPFLDKVHSSAKALGNVNTVINDHGVLTGYNTDINGVLGSLRGIVLKGKPVVLLGAGGIAQTFSYVIAKKGGKLFVFNRDLQEAQKFKKRFQTVVKHLDTLAMSIKQINPVLLINATPVGMGALKGKSLIDPAFLSPSMIVCDVIYNPLQTKLVSDARKAGCRTITGDTLFLAQGARQFELWSKKAAPRKVMEKAFYRALKSAKMQ